jgi:hypothetical protein
MQHKTMVRMVHAMVRALSGAVSGWQPQACVTQSGRKNYFLAQCLLAILLKKCYFSAGIIILAKGSKQLFFYFSGVCQKTLAELLLKCDE